MPLNEVFRALAEDFENGRLSRASSRLADELDRGVDLKTAMRSIDGERLPAYLYRSLVASVDVGQTAALLQGLARHQTTSKRLRRQVQSALLYPTIVLVLFATVLMGLMFTVSPAFREIYEDFGLTLPWATVAVLEASRTVPWAILGFLLIIPLYVIVGLLPGGRRLVHWLRTGTPMLGRLWIWSSHHEFASALGGLVSQGVVLDESISCTAASLSDRNLARAVAHRRRRSAKTAPCSRRPWASRSISIAPDRTGRLGRGQRRLARGAPPGHRDVRKGNRPANDSPAANPAAAAVHRRGRFRAHVYRDAVCAFGRSHEQPFRVTTAPMSEQLIQPSITLFLLGIALRSVAAPALRRPRPSRRTTASICSCG